MPSVEHGFAHPAKSTTDVFRTASKYQTTAWPSDALGPPLTIHMAVCHESRRSAWGLNTSVTVEIFGFNMHNPFPQDE